MSQNGCRNLFRLRIVLHQKDGDVIASLNSAFIPLSLVANLLVMTTLYRRKQLDLRSNRLYFCLSMSFSLSALLVQPMLTVLFIDSFGEVNCLLEMVTHYSYFLFSNLSSFIVLGVGTDQLVQYIDLFWYKYALTRNRALALLSGAGFMTCVLISVYTVATCHGRFEIFNSILSLVIFLCATTLAIKIERLRSNQIKKVMLLRTKEAKTRIYQYQKISSVTLMLFSTAVNSIIFATIEFYMAVNRRPSVPQQDNLTNSSLSGAHQKYLPGYLLYIAIITHPLNGVLFAVIFLCRSKDNSTYLVNTFKLLCLYNRSTKQMAAKV